MQTFIDKYIEQGRREGRQMAYREGIQEGMAEVLLRQIELKFGPPDESVRRRINAADAETLLRWLGQVLTADGLEEILS